MAAVSRRSAGHGRFMASGRTTSFVALVAPKRLAGGAAIRCPGRFAAVPGMGAGTIDVKGHTSIARNSSTIAAVQVKRPPPSGSPVWGS